MLFRLRLKLIRLLIGRLSVLVNVALDSDGHVLMADGLADNNVFQTARVPHRATFAGHCERIWSIPGSRLVESHNVYLTREFYVGTGGSDENNGLSIETRKLTLTGVEAVIKPGDVCYVVPNETE